MMSDSLGFIEGLTIIQSSFGPKETMDRLESALRAQGMNIFARIDHAAGARDVGLELRPTELIIFGNARAGTPLMRSVQTIGIDLPLKALVWEDAAAKTWISYTEPNWVSERQELTKDDARVNAMAAMLRGANDNSRESSMTKVNKICSPSLSRRLTLTSRKH
jgi:uncharacterized protein (DUF302 family)